MKDFSEGELAARELVIVKIAAEGNRSEIIQICDIFRAKIIDVSPRNLIVELTGDDNKIEGFLEIIAPYGIEDMARTGSAALPRIRKLNPRNEDKID